MSPPKILLLVLAILAIAAVPVYARPEAPGFEHNSLAIDDSTGDGDGFIEPGEPIRFNESVDNFGVNTATGVHATFTDASPGLAITQGSSAYPDMAEDAVGTNATPFAATVAPSVPCGTHLTATEHFAADQALSPTGADVTVPFQVGKVLFPVRHEARPVMPGPSQNAGAPSVDSNLDISAPGTVGHLILRIDSLQYDFDQDLRITLIGPDGTSVAVFEPYTNGGPQPNLFNTTFEDGVTPDIGEGVPPYGGRFEPSNPLSAFDGKPIQGRWTLRIEDTNPANSGPGELDVWALDIARAECDYKPPAPPPPAPPAADSKAPKMTLKGGTLALGRGGTVNVPLGCPADEVECDGTLSLVTAGKVNVSKARKLKLGSASFSVPGGKTRRVKVKLSSRARRLLAHTHSVAAMLTVSAHDKAGNKAPKLSKRVRIRATRP